MMVDDNAFARLARLTAIPDASIEIGFVRTFRVDSSEPGKPTSAIVAYPATAGGHGFHVGFHGNGPCGNQPHERRLACRLVRNGRFAKHPMKGRGGSLLAMEGHGRLHAAIFGLVWAFEIQVTGNRDGARRSRRGGRLHCYPGCYPASAEKVGGVDDGRDAVEFSEPLKKARRRKWQLQLHPATQKKTCYLRAAADQGLNSA